MRKRDIRARRRAIERNRFAYLDASPSWCSVCLRIDVPLADDGKCAECSEANVSQNANVERIGARQ